MLLEQHPFVQRRSRASGYRRPCSCRIWPASRVGTLPSFFGAGRRLYRSWTVHQQCSCSTSTVDSFSFLILAFACQRKHKQNARRGSALLPFWGKITRKKCRVNLSPKRDCGSKRVKGPRRPYCNPFFFFFQHIYGKNVFSTAAILFVVYIWRKKHALRQKV